MPICKRCLPGPLARGKAGAWPVKTASCAKLLTSRFCRKPLAPRQYLPVGGMPELIARRPPQAFILDSPSTNRHCSRSERGECADQCLDRLRPEVGGRAHAGESVRGFISGISGLVGGLFCSLSARVPFFRLLVSIATPIVARSSICGTLGKGSRGRPFAGNRIRKNLGQ